MKNVKEINQTIGLKNVGNINPIKSQQEALNCITGLNLNFEDIEVIRNIINTTFPDNLKIKRKVRGYVDDNLEDIVKALELLRKNGINLVPASRILGLSDRTITNSLKKNGLVWDAAKKVYINTLLPEENNKNNKKNNDNNQKQLSLKEIKSTTNNNNNNSNKLTFLQFAKREGLDTKMSETTGTGVAHRLYYVNQALLKQMADNTGYTIQSLINDAIFQHSKRILPMEVILEIFSEYSETIDQINSDYRTKQNNYND